MEYRQLANTPLKLSVMGLGTMTWGEQNTEQEAFAQLSLATDQGINFIDTAEMYPIPPSPNTFAETESILGRWLEKRGQRDQLVIGTKVTGRGDRNRGLEHIRNGARLDAKSIEAALNDSLVRLKTDYVDLYQVHWPERATTFFGKLDYQAQDDTGIAIEETYAAMANLVKAGKVRHIGISNETPWGTMRYQQCAKDGTSAPIVSVQNPYNLLNRTFDTGLSEVCHREDISLLAYSPLAFGVLTGKYLDGKADKSARLNRYDRFTRYAKVNVEEATRAYWQLAHDHGMSLTVLSLAYVNQHPRLASNIIGATNLDQLQENIDAHRIQLTPEILTEIDKIHHKYPNPAP